MWMSLVGMTRWMLSAPDLASAATADFRLQTCVGYEFDRFHFAFRNRRKPSFNYCHTEFIQSLGDPEFVFRS